MNYAIFFKNNKGERYEGHCELMYEDGLIHKVEIKMDITDVQRHWFLSNIPPYESEVFLLNSKQIEVNKLSVNIPFSEFWDAYGYKMGKKPRAEKLWKLMSDVDKAECMKAIPKYKRFLQSRSQEMIYPEGFLSQRRWENEF